MVETIDLSLRGRGECERLRCIGDDLFIGLPLKKHKTSPCSRTLSGAEVLLPSPVFLGVVNYFSTGVGVN
jgi:hypothetical protein